MEVTLASSFPGSGDGVLLPTSRQAAMELTVCGSGRRACVPVSLEAECLSVLDTQPSPLGPSRHFMCQGCGQSWPAGGGGLGNTAA